jgi:hypothetical protein
MVGARHIGVLVAVVLGLALAGCGDSGADDSREDSQGSGVAAPTEVPDFEGPYVQDLTRIYRETDIDFVRQVLVDGKVSDQELAEMRQRFDDCTAAFGITGVEFGPDGSISLEGPEGADPTEVNNRVKQCSHESGEDDIAFIHSIMRRNPDGLDENTIMAACLVKKGIVDPSYDAEAYREDFMNSSGPMAETFPEGPLRDECIADPLGILE